MEDHGPNFGYIQPNPKPFVSPHCSAPSETKTLSWTIYNKSQTLFVFVLWHSGQFLLASCRSIASQAGMKVIAAYLLAVLGGNLSPSANDLKGILASVGAEADNDRIKFLLSEVAGKDIAEVIAAGREKLASVPSGGGGAVAVSASAPGGGSGAAPAAAEPKKEEKVEEKEESDDDMGFSLFD